MSATPKKTSCMERLLSLGFKIAAPDDPIYRMGWTITVNPSMEILEESFEIKAKDQDSFLDLINPSVEPAQEAPDMAVTSLSKLDDDAKA